MTRLGVRAAFAICAPCLMGAVLCATATTVRGQGVRSVPVGVVRSPRPGTPLFAAVPATTPGRPALEPARVVGEALAGAYAGIAGYFIGSMAVGGVAELSNVSDDMKEHIAFVGGVIGAGAATAASVWAIGNIGDQTGSFPMSAAGTAAGVAAGILLNQIIYGHARLPSAGESSRMRWVEASLEALLPSIGATIAFNSTRRFK